MKKRTIVLTVFLVVLAGLGITDMAELIWKWAVIKADGLYIETFSNGVKQCVIGAVAAAILGMIWVTWVEDEMTNATNEGFSRAWDLIREELEGMKK